MYLCFVGYILFFWTKTMGMAASPRENQGGVTPSRVCEMPQRQDENCGNCKNVKFFLLVCVFLTDYFRKFLVRN